MNGVQTEKSTIYDTSLVVEVNHALVQDRLATLRDKDSDHVKFRDALKQIGLILAVEVTKNLPLVESEVETPNCKTKVKRLESTKVTFLPILRAGLGLVDSCLKVLPEAKVGHIGLARNEETLKAEEYYLKLPKNVEDDLVVIVDPMLSTAGSIIYTIDRIKEVYSVKKVVVLCLMATPQGLQRLQAKHPEVIVYCASVDEKLGDNGYIIPGLGDAGDRIYGTFAV